MGPSLCNPGGRPRAAIASVIKTRPVCREKKKLKLNRNFFKFVICKHFDVNKLFPQAHLALPPAAQRMTRPTKGGHHVPMPASEALILSQ